MKQYKSYKDSGVEWIGQIPEGWKCLPMKHGLTINNGKDYKGVQSDNGYPVIGSGGPFAFATEYLHNGEAVLLGRKGTIDRPMYINEKFWTVDTMFYAIPKSGICCKYMYYQSLTIPFGLYSTNTALPSMTQLDLANNPMCFPPLSEQQAIASYLDHKVSQVDAAITENEQMLEDLKAYRSAIISEAVTKGLDKDVEMKNCGIEWLDMIPRHWKILPFKRMFSFGRGLSITKADLVEEGIPVISYGQIHSKQNTGTKVEQHLLRFVPDSLGEGNESSKVNKGDFIFADTSEDLEGCGNCVYIDNDYLLYAGYHSIIAKSLQSSDNKYFAYLFKTDNWRSQIRSSVNGVKVFSITQNSLANTEVILPPISEQQAISSYLDNKVNCIDISVKEIESQIEDLKAYRSSLITEAVTGKVDLRDWKLNKQ